MGISNIWNGEWKELKNINLSKVLNILGMTNLSE